MTWETQKRPEHKGPFQPQGGPQVQVRGGATRRQHWVSRPPGPPRVQGPTARAAGRPEFRSDGSGSKATAPLLLCRDPSHSDHGGLFRRRRRSQRQRAALVITPESLRCNSRKVTSCNIKASGVLGSWTWTVAACGPVVLQGLGVLSGPLPLAAVKGLVWGSGASQILTCRTSLCLSPCERASKRLEMWVSGLGERGRLVALGEAGCAGTC